MKNKQSKKIIMSVLSFVLITAMALGFSACKNNGSDTPETSSNPTVQASENNEGFTELGVGQKMFIFEVTDKDGTVKKFRIKTDAQTVGDALLEKGLISGTESEYGLMVDTVNGVKYDYNADKAYWAFFVNGEYAQTGVDSTPVTDNAVYSFVSTAAA